MATDNIQSVFFNELIKDNNQLLSSIFDFSKIPVSMLIGYAAEIKLIEYLRTVPGFRNLEKIPDSSKVKGDILVKDSTLNLRIEVKCIKSGKSSTYNSDIDRLKSSVKIKTSDSWITDFGVKTTNPPRGQWDILAICTFTLTGTWDFLFISNNRIPSSKLSDNLLPSEISIDTEITPYLYRDILDVISDLC